MQFKDPNAFIKELLKTQRPIPYYWPGMKVVNAKGPEILGTLKAPQALGPGEFKNLIASDDVQLLDTRNMLGFGGGHIPGALNIGYSSSISMWGGWLLDPKRPIAMVTPSEGDPVEVVKWLVRVGLEKFVGTLKGGMDSWTKAAGEFVTVTQMSVQELNKQKGDKNLQILDVRAPSEWDHGHIPNARYMFLPEISKRMGELDKSKPVVVYCGTGYQASIGSSLLKRGGFDVQSVPGSFDGWLAAKYEVEIPAKAGKAADTKRG
ncbi:MAG: rhodanese-like domain-containing protein [Alphaproteobacteria bacterium]|nr:MAG: rhodanese-like domain-containing protein [Alphaproteobacteria bacterium]